ncbi:hypothetical protein FDECE_634 [Fusarium decemcellulare]|nr:hypothetical protein FDECE_634 [Fusarium decemcellulare]
MASLVSWLLGRTPQGPAAIPTDEVVPLHPFDDTLGLRDFTLIWTFKFDEVLDADLLGQSLSRLFKMEGWRKLGGRIHLRPDGKAEIHVPQPFTKQRPPLYFTKEHHDICLANHPEASKLPEASAQPAMFPSARHYSGLALGPGAPRTIQDYFQNDVPQFSLHVVTFTDGTLVSISFNHVSSDLGGLTAILKAWGSMLAGKPEEVAPFVGYKDDPMKEIYKPDNPTLRRPIIAEFQLTGWRAPIWALRHVIETWWTGLEGRMMCIPKKAIDAVIQDARDHIALNGDAGLFVSENDVVMAICNRLLASPLSLDRSMINLIIVDARSRVKSAFRDNAAYVQNMSSIAVFACQAKEAVELPIGEVALRSRIAVTEQCTEEQVKSTVQETYDALVSTGNPAIIGKDVNSLFMVVSNWSKAGFLTRFDFSPAIVKPARSTRSGAKPGHPVYFHSGSLGKGFPSTNRVFVMGRDLTGNFWLSGELPTASWESGMRFFNSYMRE